MSASSPLLDVGQDWMQPFGRYRLIQRLATGGMAEVFLAEMTGPLGFRRRVALKRILPHLARDTVFVRAFVDEARVGGLLIHPNIVQTLDFDFVDGIPYLAMEFVEGGHLGQLVEQARALQRPLPPELICDLMLQAARGLAFAHQARDPDGKPLALIHRDIKPPNLLYSRAGQVKISDFGIAKAASNLTQTMPDTVKGSLHYMSPEQASGSRAMSQASDLFSLGAVLYELLTLERLFHAETAGGLLAVVGRGPSPASLKKLSQLAPTWHPLEAIAQGLLHVQPEGRFPDAEALLQALELLPYPALSPMAQASLAQEWLELQAPTAPRPPAQDTLTLGPVCEPESEEEACTHPVVPEPDEPTPYLPLTPPDPLPADEALSTSPGTGEETTAPIPQLLVSTDDFFVAPEPPGDREPESRPQPTTSEALPPAPSLEVASQPTTPAVAPPLALPAPIVHGPGPTVAARPKTLPGTHPRRKWWMGIGGLAIAGLASLGLLWRQPPLDKAAAPKLIIIAEPVGEVFLDQRRLGTSPLTVTLRQSGSISLEVRTASMPARHWEGEVAAGENRVIEFPPPPSAPRSWLNLGADSPAGRP